MNDSILNTIKNMLGIPIEDNSFDQDIMININSVFGILYQIGIGTKTSFYIVDSAVKWTEMFADYIDLVDMIKNYTYMKVRLYFDSPTNASVLESLNRQIKEFEWRIQLQVEKAFEDNPKDD